ncbi:MAG: helix-turn-helix domain-containing protein [Planctomycetota bacterium]
MENTALVPELTPPNTQQIPRLALTPAEAATAIGISRRTLHDLIHDPDAGFPSIKVGRRLMIPVDGLREWLRG